jgi:AraC-like DNA-binding protein
MDPLTDIVSLLRPHGAFSKPITGRGRWGVRYEEHAAPSFCIVREGRCWFNADGGKPRLLEHGDFLLLPFTPAFSLVSDLEAVCVPGRPSRDGVRHGDPKGAPDFRMIGGTFEIESVNAALLGMMSQTIHIRASECDTSRLGSIIQLIMDEYAAERPGREAILQRFLEALLVEALRWPGLREASLSPGLIAGLRDKQISVALHVIHSDVRHGWTVTGLAKHAGMSRSAFAARFTAAVGCAPMEYLTRWRMSLAQDALSRGGRTLDRLAEEIGYESASAFSTAFRRRFGCPPGAFGRIVRQTHQV